MRRRVGRAVLSIALALCSGGAVLGVGIATSGPAYANSFCGAPANQWGINYCGTGLPITSSNLPSGVCSAFKCIANFTNGTGYMVECTDGTVSMSGGDSGACSGHGGVKQQAYLDASLASTPTTTTAAIVTTTSPPAPPPTTAVPTTTAAPAVAATSGALATTGPGSGLLATALVALGLVSAGAGTLFGPRWRRKRA